MKFQNKIPKPSFYCEFQSSLIKRLMWPYPFDDELTRWRAQILFSILFSGLALGTIAFVGALAAIADKGSWMMAIADIVGIGLGLILLQAPKIKFELRAAIACLILFFIGVMTILFLGPQLGGPAWLFGFSVLTGVLLGSAYAFGAIILNAIFLIIVCFLVLNGQVEYNMPYFSSPKDMIATITNFLVVNSITAISVSFLVKGVFGIYKEKLQLTKELEKEIKEKKSQEIKLKESEKRFRDMAELMPETIFEVDSTGKLTFVNKRAFDLFGYTIDDFKKGINILDAISEKDKKKASQNIEKIIQGESAGINEYEIIKKDGTSFPALFHSSAIYNENNVIGFRGFLIDITEKKRTQELLIQSEKMMSIGGLAAGMAHEINNPLAGMIQNSQLIQNRLTQDINANSQVAEKLGTSMSIISQFMEKRGILKQLENIQKAGRQAAKIIDNMLSFAKKSDSNKTESSLSELIEKTIGLAGNDYSLKKNYDFRRIKIIRDFSLDVPAVQCESSKIQQVLFNIIKNASEALQEKSNNEVSKIIFRLKKESNFACIEIEDNGPGMESRTIKRIFEPFFTTKSVDKGTGLGLSVSYFIIVNDHKGELDVESQVGRGTKFTIKLPIVVTMNKNTK